MTKTARNDLALGVQCFFTGLVGLGAAFASYRHGLQFALRFGADETTAWIWPLIVDGLLTIATVELWKSGSGSRWQAWLAFVFGISLSLCANIASAPELSIFGVMVAACPPSALLLAVELLNRALKRRRSAPNEASEVLQEPVPDELSTDLDHPVAKTAEQRMREFYEAECRQGRTPTGADLDRIAGTHNYGRRILRKWRAAGHTASVAGEQGNHRWTVTTGQLDGRDNHDVRPSALRSVCRITKGNEA